MENLTINIILVCIILFIYIYRTYILTEPLISHSVNGKKFKVYDTFDDYQTAGEMLYEIDLRINKLFIHLDKKFIKSNKHDISNVLKERLNKMIKSYDISHLKENFPVEVLGDDKPDSSFTLNKKKMAICLRDDKTKKFHNINDIMFVCIHELSHIINPTYGHPKSFWQYMKFLLHESVEIGIYKPVNYGKKYVKYCNTTLKSNPYYNVIECDKKIPNTCSK